VIQLGPALPAHHREAVDWSAGAVRILALSDRVVSMVNGQEIQRQFGDVDLLLGCGDLPADYLEYALTALNVPLIYVAGNHDPERLRVPGGMDADGRLLEEQGLRILGFGGSRRYKPEGRNQYTEAEMAAKVYRKLIPLMPAIVAGRPAFDILLAHSPPRGIHDAEDPAHRGFTVFRRLLRWAKPPLMVHGHTHVVPNLATTETVFEATRILNVYPYRLIDWPVQVAADG
jgi:predicted phosphodiesterase